VLCQNNPSLQDQNLNPSKFKYEHPITFSPSEYICYKTEDSIKIDGLLSKSEWNNIPWTEDFTDIEGGLKPTPYLRTRVKMTWNDRYFYVAAVLEEPHIWATLTQRDDIMFQDDDFEIFIDPDGDGHNYFEFEMNAFNAIWDLYMLYPYYMDHRRNYIMNWDMKGIKSAVQIEGTLNKTSDIDSQWSIEVAIPWEEFKDFKKGNHIPIIGEQWRINFSRVDWYMDIVEQEYIKRKDEDGKKIRENNWVWSPTGYVNMHKPETWGYVQFENHSNAVFTVKNEEKVRWAIWQLYYQVKECWKDGEQPCTLEQFTLPKAEIDNYKFIPELSINEFGFNIKAKFSDNNYFIINELGLIEKQISIE